MAELIELLKRYETGCNAADAAAVAALYTTDGVILPEAMPTAAGAEVAGFYAGAFEALQLTLKSVPKSSLTFYPPRLHFFIF